jgi:pyridinium-3,5-bisthiocarboxylic acid mononucleotide nickel chelatase
METAEAKIAYFDCQFGAAGDMLLGALLDAGLDEPLWLAELKKIALPKDSFEIAIKTVQRSNITARKVDVIAHDHVHERKASEIEKIISASKISDPARELALRIVRRLAVCEGKLHGIAPSEVHLHELGAIDSIVDITGFAIGYDMLGLERSFISRIPLGRGVVKMEHGHFPLPAPAVARMLADIQAPTLDFEIDFECLTPTAVAIMAEISQDWGKLPRFEAIKSVGYGAGTKDVPDWPNVCRVILGSQ